MKGTDWTKKISEYRNKIELLNEQLLEQQKMYTELKTQLITLAQTTEGNKKHIELFIEEQSKELIKTKKIV